MTVLAEESTKEKEQLHQTPADADVYDDEQGSLDFGEPSALRPALTRLLQAGAEGFDPVRFSYICSLAQKALAQEQQSLMLIVEEKALQALQKYQADFAQARSETAEIVAAHRKRFPANAAEVTQIFARGDFNAVKRLHRNAISKAALQPLLELTDQLQQISPAANQEDLSEGFDALLLAQEYSILQHAVPGDEQRSASTHPKELKSVDLYRRSSSKHKVKKTMSRAIKQAPKAPGPLNPQMLATHTLTTMRDLSPRYLSKLLPYLDTLFCLENSAEKNRTGKKKARKKRKAAE